MASDNPIPDQGILGSQKICLVFEDLVKPNTTGPEAVIMVTCCLKENPLDATLQSENLSKSMCRWRNMYAFITLCCTYD